MDFVQIGGVIREARMARGCTQEEIARLLGMSRATISGIERGTVNEIGVRELMAVCAAVGLELNAAIHVRPTLRELRNEALGHRGLPPRR